MSKYSQSGSAATTAAIVLLSLALAGSMAFGAWAFWQRQDYKNNVDKKVTTAVEATKKAQAAELQSKFAESSKSPYRAYKGPATFGSLTFAYPKTWSAYVDESNTSQPINAYFHPNQVPGVQSTTAYALRVELVTTAYDQVVQQYTSQVKAGKLTASAYIPPKLAGVANVQPGTHLVGAISQSEQATLEGAMLIIKLRDKTLKIYTQSPNFLADFNKVILPTLAFAP